MLAKGSWLVMVMVMVIKENSSLGKDWMSSILQIHVEIGCKDAE